MIELGLERNRQGKYILDSCEDQGFSQSFCSKGVSLSFWIASKDGKRYIIKSDGSGSKYYKFSIYGELLFSYIAKMNNIPSANIDIGSLNNIDYIISEDVCEQDAEVLSLENLFKSVDRFNYSVEGVSIAANLFSKRFGIELEDDLKFKLYKYALIDFLCWQNDRHDDNLIFQIVEKDGKKYLKLGGLFDNESVFMFDVIRKYLTTSQHFRREYQVNSQLEDLILLQIEDKLSSNWPAFGTNFDVRMMEMRDNDILTKKRDIDLGKKIRERMAKSFAKEMQRNPKLKQFYENLDLDLFKASDQIVNDINCYIPREYLEYAEELICERKNMIDECLLEEGQQMEEIK